MLSLISKLLAVLPFACFALGATSASAQVGIMWQTLLTNEVVEDFAADAMGGFALAYPTAEGTNSTLSITAAGITRVDAGGSRLWTRVLPEMNVAFRGRGFVAMDATGNIYVVGRSNSAAPVHHLHKLDPSGLPLWRVDEPLGTGSYAFIATDNGGQVAMAATQFGAGGSRLWIAKYRTDGVAEWKTNLAVASDSVSVAIALASDRESNWLLHGRAHSIWTTSVDALLKLSPDGVVLWSQQTDGMNEFHVAPDNSLFVSLESGFQKWSPTGEIIWSITNRLTVLDIEANGELLVSEFVGVAPPSVARLSADGRVLWRTPLRRPAVTHARDANGNHVFGTTRQGYWSETIQLAGIDPSGNPLWVFDDLPYGQGFTWLPHLVSGSDGALRIVAQPVEQPRSSTVVAALQTMPVTGWPRFTLHPSNQVAAAFQAVQFRVEVEGDALVQWQWYRGTSSLPGETNSTFTIGYATFADSGDYYVEARNATGALFSRIGTLRVVYPPSVSSPPQYVSLALNASVELPGYPSGTDAFLYQWRRNGVTLAHETNVVLRLRNAQTDSAGEYTVTVSNEVGAITNLAAVVRIAPSVSEVWRDQRSISNCCDLACEQVVNPGGGVFLANGVEVLKYSPAGALEWLTNDSAFGLVPDGAGGVIYGSYINLTRLDAQGQALWQTNGSVPPLAIWDNWIVTAGDNVWLQDLNGIFVGGLTPECRDCHWQAIRILQPEPGGSLVCAGLVGVDSFNHDLGLAKLNREGQTQWFVRPGIPLFYGPDNQFALATGSDGGVTVAVVVEVGARPPAAYRLITLRLDAEGRELWRNVCDDLLSSGGAHLVLDASGNAIAAGPGCIVKYDTHGNQLWRTPSGHPQFGVHLPKALAVGEDGAIYLAGNGSSYWQQMILEKLSPEGNSLWASALDSIWAISALADLDLAEDGSVYVSFADYRRSSTIRFAESAVGGVPLIVTNPEPSLVVLPCGAGFTASAGAGATGEGTLRYQWFFQAPSTWEATALPGATNQTLALSNLCQPDSGHYFLEVRNENGVATSRPVTVDAGFVPFFAVQDEDSSVLADVAHVNSGGSIRLRVFTYWNELPSRWQWFFNGEVVPGATNTFLEVTNAAETQAGVYALVGANKYGANTNSLRLFVEDRVQTLFETGEAVGKVNQYENPDPLRPRLAVNRANEVYLLGTEFLETAGVTQWFVTKYSEDGDRLWRISPPDPAGSSTGVAILLDAGENLLVAANEDGSQGEAGMRLLKFGPDGGLLWQTNYSDAPSFARQAHDLVSNRHDLFLGGMGYDSEGSTNFLFVLKLNQDGQQIWEARAPHESGFGFWFDRPGFAPAEDGGIYAAGSLGLTRFGVSGARLWEQAGAFHGLTLDPSGRIYAARRWTGLSCFAPDGDLLWTSDWSGTAPLADASGVFTLDLYRVFRHSATGALEWTSSPNGGTALALAQGGGCIVSRCLESKMQTRRLAANGSETWLAISAAPSDLQGFGSAVEVCPNGDIVSAHLLIRGRTMTNPPTAFYLLQRLRESTNIAIPTLRISPTHAQARPGERVCFTAQFSGGPAQFQWFHGSYPMFNETNVTLCLSTAPRLGANVWVHAVTDDGGFASPEVQLEILLPYIGLPEALPGGLWRVPIWSKWSYIPLLLESSTNLLHWEETSFWQNTYSDYFYYDFPQTTERQRYFRLRHVLPQPGL